MEFVTDEQEKFFTDHADIANKGKDYAALVYTLGISPTCRQHFAQLFDTEKGGINPAAITAGWQTGASTKITRLAFDLFTWHTAEGDNPENYAPKELFSGLDDEHRKGAAYSIYYFA